MSLRLSAKDRLIGLIPWVVGALFGAAALHLLAVLAMPALAPHAAFRKLALRLPLGEKALLPRAEAEAPGPAFSDPFASLAICRFDLTQGPLRLSADADGDHPLSVSVRLADGTVLYSANDLQTPGGRFRLRVVTQAQADAQDAADAGDETAADDELRLVSPGARGFVVFRVLASREGDYDAAAAARNGLSCALEKPEP